MKLSGPRGEARIVPYSDRLSGDTGWTVTLYGPAPSKDSRARQTFTSHNTVTPLGMTGVWLEARGFAQEWIERGTY